MTDAALGAEIDVPTIDGGKSKVKIPEGTQNGKQFRLKGKGMPVYGTSSHGDLYVKIQVKLPDKLTPEQKELVMKLRDSVQKTNR